jgi:eukaryotic-like serine/threonine-protein kinase
MLCYRCGSHNQEGSHQCATCGQVFTGAFRTNAAHKLVAKSTESMKTSPFAEGDVIAERFVIEGFVGFGPSGHVYRAKDLAFRSEGSDEIVALKVVHRRLLQTVEDRALFERAVQRTKKISHGGIARVFTSGIAKKDDGVERVFFTMQLVGGQSLDRIIAHKKSFSLAECEPIIQQVARALEYSHRFTAHGMLKPQNIIVEPGELRVTDFAMTRGLPRKPYFAALGDALHYTAPELRKDGADVLPTADVFSLGVVLTEMLTGTRPDTVRNARIEISDAPGMTSAIRFFLAKAMDIAPDKRWRSPGEVMQALQSLVEEPMSEPVIISAPVPLNDPPPLPHADDLPSVEVSLSGIEQLTPPVVETPTELLPVEPVAAVLPPARRPRRPVAPAPRRAAAPAQPARSMLVAREAKSSSRGMVAAASVFVFCASLVGFAVWARGRSEQAPATTPSNVPLPAPAHAEQLPTPVVEKTRGSEPVKVAGLNNVGFTREEKKTERPAKPVNVIEPPVVKLDKNGCRPGMVFVAAGRFTMGSSPADEFHNFSDKLLQSVDVSGFCIDRYEYPNAMGERPLINVTLKQAQATCETQGKRLCAEEEWERACKGPQNARFPYGNEFEPGTCNVGSEEGGGSLKPIGAQSRCRSGFGVVDMSGNVAEMTSSSLSGSDIVVKGGDSQHPDYAARCAHRSAQGPSKRSNNVGFRCCAGVEK